MGNKETIFLTGATGLIGSYLLKLLLEDGHKVFVLARSRDNKTAQERVHDICRFWDKEVLNKNFNNLVVLEGDITKDDLGLRREIGAMLGSEVEAIFHCAANTKFSLSLEPLRKVNVEGTRNVLKWGLEWNKKGRLQRVVHLSTVFIYGDYKGLFSENDLDLGQKFYIAYEQSKFEGEKVVNIYRKKGLWVDIFRPPVVVGESKTGRIPFFDQAFYQAIHIWNSGIFDYYPNVEDYNFTIDFVDELCKSIIIIFSHASAPNNNYHPFSNHPLSVNKTMELFSQHFAFKRPKPVSLYKFFKEKSTFAQRQLMKYIFHFFSKDIKLSSEITSEILRECSFEFSSSRETALLKLVEYCLGAGFLKKKR